MSAVTALNVHAPEKNDVSGESGFDDFSNLKDRPTIDWDAAPRTVEEPAPAARADVGEQLGTRFFWVEASLLSQERTIAFSPDELLLFLLHCRGYAPVERVSKMGEKSAKERLFMRKKAWTNASEGLTKKGLIRAMPNANHRCPRTAIGSPAEPWLSDEVPELDNPGKWDRHRYRDASDREIVKMPWALVDGHDGAEPVLADLRSKAAILVLMALYLVARGDGMVPAKYAHLDNDGTTKHDLGSIVENAERCDLTNGLREVLDAGLVVPSHLDTQGRHVLWLWHPLESATASATAGGDESLAAATTATPIRTEALKH